MFVDVFIECLVATCHGANEETEAVGKAVACRNHTANSEG